ncbi:MAG TPA: C40 family peptidase [Trebonia sp.]|jgi:cell wall-associated NlpC family hydrolase|nr:C40 family peptidase [Trebonia sp.]
MTDYYGMVELVHLTDRGQRMARAIRRGGFRRLLPAGVAAFAAAGTLAGVLTSVAAGSPGGALNATSSGRTPHSASSPFGLPQVRPTTGDASVLPGMAPTAQLLADQAVSVKAGSGQPSVAPLRRTVQADLLIVAPSALPRKLLTKISGMTGVTAAEQIEAVRMKINGSYTAVVGVNPSQFRSFAARPTAKSNALWEGVASGGVAVSYTMGKLDKLPLGGPVTAAGSRTERLRVVAFGTLGIGGVNAVVSDAVARSLGAPAGNAIVISTKISDFAAVRAALGKLIPHGAGVEDLVTVVNKGGSAEPSSSGAAGAGAANESAVPGSALDTMLKAAMSRQGLPYVWGGDGPKVFDCSGLVQWSFRQAGIVMPRVAADQALTGPSVPVSQLQAGDLLFYHTDPTDPAYISHVAIYIGNGWMIQAPEPGEDVQVVPAAFGSEFAGAVRVNPAQAAAVAGGVA